MRDLRGNKCHLRIVATPKQAAKIVATVSDQRNTVNTNHIVLFPAQQLLQFIGMQTAEILYTWAKHHIYTMVILETTFITDKSSCSGLSLYRVKTMCTSNFTLGSYPGFVTTRV